MKLRVGNVRGFDPGGSHFSALKIIALWCYFFSASSSVSVSKLSYEGAAKIILVYSLDACGGTEIEDAATGTQLQTSRKPRDYALPELARRISELRSARQVYEGRRLASNDATSSAIVTRYLQAIQMEIAAVPEDVEPETMLQMAESLPCVEMASADYTRTYETVKPVVEVSDDSENPNFPSTIASPKGGNIRRGLAAVNSPNDRLFSQQWHLQSGEQWGTNAQSVWPEWRGAPSMVVAIIDSGCDLRHPDLANKRWTNPGEICGDGIDNDRNGYVDDCHGWDWVDGDNDPSPVGSGHGTAAAGIIAASTHNSVGIAGICWSCHIMCLRFIQGVEGRISNQVAAIDYAAKMGAKISNNSYGGYGFSKLEYEVIRRAKSYGHLFVASAGNNNYNTDLPQYDHTPSIYNLNNILALGASTASGRKASYSNYGRKSVDLFAPGSKIVTTENGGGYAVVSGTSFAAPMGVGVAALIWSRFPQLSHQEVISVLTTTCKRTSSLADMALCGGVIDTSAAMRAAEEAAKRKRLQQLRADDSGSNAATAAADDVISNNDTGFADNGEEPDFIMQAYASAGSQQQQSNSASSRSGLQQHPGDLTPVAYPGYTGWLGAFLNGFNSAFSRTGSMLHSFPEDTISFPGEDEGVEGSYRKHIVLNEGLSGGRSGGLNGGLSGGFSEGFNKTEDVSLLTQAVEEALKRPYLLFSGNVFDGGQVPHDVLIDPIYLSEKEFDWLLSPYESTLGLRMNGDVTGDEAGGEAIVSASQLENPPLARSRSFMNAVEGIVISNGLDDDATDTLIEPTLPPDLSFASEGARKMTFLGGQNALSGRSIWDPRAMVRTFVSLPTQALHWIFPSERLF